MLKVYNTLNRKKETFKPIHEGKVGMYTCGPTVYWYQHIGNLRSYIFSDILKRVLNYNNYKVKHVINITDVGHLTSDADEGEDKMEKSAAKEGKTPREIANYYFKIFEQDLEKLNIIQPAIWCNATRHIAEQIDLIDKLEEKGYTYKTSDGMYFDTSKFKDYAKLGKLNIENLKGGKRVSLGEKKNKTDFALWKFSPKGGKRLQEWRSPWGTGFPGWHIECSAMATKYLGEQFDIHTGGEDHVPIHHTNEIAQSECGFGVKPWVKYWMHGAFLTFSGEKMSKSSGKIATLDDLNKQGFSAMDYRYFVLTGHYRKQLNFTKNNLENAKNSYERLKNIIKEIPKEKEFNKKYITEFEKAINDDLDMPKAMQVLWELVRDSKAKHKYETIEKMDEIFGLDLLKFEKVKIPREVKKLVQEREDARKNKDWANADKFRDEVKKLGYQINDTKDGVEVLKI
jgi:cysteinyl-tRNA synthetase